jgi:NADPH:quinone reductase-like Zn-dependent oxidoreductase
MKVIVYNKFGTPDVLQLETTPRPEPGDNDVLIEVRATTVTSGDIHLRKGKPLLARLFAGPITPRNPVLGHELAGVIAAVGKDVKLFSVGDRVFASTHLASGAYAEFLCLPEDGIIALMPDNISYEQAAAIPVGALTALYFLRKAGIRRDQRVLVYGASGSVGTFAVQLAVHFGAVVTGVCSHVNIELVKNQGATRVIDYSREDFSTGNDCYDIIFDTVGKTSFLHCKNVLNPDGRYVTTAISMSLLVQRLLASISGSSKLILGIAEQSPEDLDFIKDLVEAGMIKPVIDRQYPLQQITDAHAYVEQGHKKGNVVIRMAAE